MAHNCRAPAALPGLPAPTSGSANRVLAVLHDAEVVALALRREGESVLTLAALDPRTNEGWIHVVFSLRDISGLEPQEFTSQNVINQLEIAPVGAEHRLTMDPCFGLTDGFKLAKLTSGLKMIDRPTRNLATALVQRFAAGEITNDALIDGWPRSEDPAIPEIEYHLTSIAEDMIEYRLDSRVADPALRALLERVGEFLRSDRPYEWPRVSERGLDLLGAFIPGLSWILGLRRIRKFRRAGDVPAWPFLRALDVESTWSQ